MDTQKCTGLDEHDQALVKAAKSTIWEKAITYLDQVHSDEAYAIIDNYCRSQYHRYNN